MSDRQLTREDVQEFAFRINDALDAIERLSLRAAGRLQCCEPNVRDVELIEDDAACIYKTICWDDPQRQYEVELACFAHINRSYGWNELPLHNGERHSGGEHGFLLYEVFNRYVRLCQQLGVASVQSALDRLHGEGDIKLVPQLICHKTISSVEFREALLPYVKISLHRLSWERSQLFAKADNDYLIAPDIKPASNHSPARSTNGKAGSPKNDGAMFSKIPKTEATASPARPELDEDSEVKPRIHYAFEPSTLELQKLITEDGVSRPATEDEIATANTELEDALRREGQSVNWVLDQIETNPDWKPPRSTAWNTLMARSRGNINGLSHGEAAILAALDERDRLIREGKLVKPIKDKTTPADKETPAPPVESPDSPTQVSQRENAPSCDVASNPVDKNPKQEERLNASKPVESPVKTVAIGSGKTPGNRSKWLKLVQFRNRKLAETPDIERDEIINEYNRRFANKSRGNGKTWPVADLKSYRQTLSDYPPPRNIDDEIPDSTR